MDSNDREHLEKLRARHIEALRVLEEQEAKLGLQTPPHVITEIQSRRGEVARIDKQLQQPSHSQSRASSRVAQIQAELDDFYRPLYNLLSVDKSLWQQILGISEEAGSDEQKLAVYFEENKIIPLHQEMVSIITPRLSLARSHPRLKELLQQYLERATVYLALRHIGNTISFSKKESSNTWWHQDLSDAIERRIDELEEEYKQLTSAQL